MTNDHDRAIPAAILSLIMNETRTGIDHENTAVRYQRLLDAFRAMNEAQDERIRKLEERVKAMEKDNDDPDHIGDLIRTKHKDEPNMVWWTCRGCPSCPCRIPWPEGEAPTHCPGSGARAAWTREDGQ